jgi:hypothetical protein
MAYQYLTPDNVVETFKDSRQYTEGLTDSFPEYERLSRNKPHASIPKEYPKTTDGTTASIIRKTPHRIIQQLPTGKVTSTTDDWLSVIAEFIYYDRIIPNANEGYALLQKCWLVVERFLAFGSCPTYAPFVQHNGYFCTDLRLPYWGDVFLQPGKISDEDSNYIFLRSWWQTKDIEALIDAQSKLGKDVEKTWDVGNLRRVKEMSTTKDEKAKTPAEREKQINTNGGIEFITGFQRGQKSKFYTFHVNSGLLLRTKINKDPRGELPVSFAYGDLDGSNPLGRSIIDLVGSLQNLMDGQMQMHQYREALMLNPPLIKRGNWNKNKIKFVPNAIIDMGSGDPNVNSLEALKIDTSANANFAANYQLMQSQLFGLLSTPNTTISSEVGSVSQSKTPQGVEQNKANLSIDDNYVRKQFETWFERWSETAINLYFAEREGVEELQLDQDTVDKLMKLAEQGKFDPQMLSEDNMIRLDYSSATPALKFEVDASTSKMQDEVQQLQALSGLEDLLRKSEMLQKIVPLDKQVGLWNAMVKNSKVDDHKALSLNDDEIQKAVAAASQQPDPERQQVNTNYKDLPEDIKRQEEQKLGFQPSAMTSPAQQQLDTPEQAAPEADPNAVTPDHLLKAHDQAHQQEMDKAKLLLEAQKIGIAKQQANTQEKVANKPVPKPAGK